MTARTLVTTPPRPRPDNPAATTARHCRSPRPTQAATASPSPDITHHDPPPPPITQDHADSIATQQTRVSPRRRFDSLHRPGHGSTRREASRAPRESWRRRSVRRVRASPPTSSCRALDRSPSLPNPRLGRIELLARLDGGKLLLRPRPPAKLKPPDEPENRVDTLAFENDRGSVTRSDRGRLLVLARKRHAVLNAKLMQSQRERAPCGGSEGEERASRLPRQPGPASDAGSPEPQDFVKAGLPLAKGGM